MIEERFLVTGASNLHRPSNLHLIKLTQKLILDILEETAYHCSSILLTELFRALVG